MSWIYFVAIVFQGMVLSYWAAHLSGRFGWVALGILIGIAVLIGSGGYPSIWHRGHGFFTPNRVVSTLLYITLFGGSAAWGEWRRVCELADYLAQRRR